MQTISVGLSTRNLHRLRTLHARTKCSGMLAKYQNHTSESGSDIQSRRTRRTAQKAVPSSEPYESSRDLSFVSQYSLLFGQIILRKDLSH